MYPQAFPEDSSLLSCKGGSSGSLVRRTRLQPQPKEGSVKWNKDYGFERWVERNPGRLPTRGDLAR